MGRGSATLRTTNQTAASKLAPKAIRGGGSGGMLTTAGHRGAGTTISGRTTSVLEESVGAEGGPTLSGTLHHSGADSPRQRCTSMYETQATFAAGAFAVSQQLGAGWEWESVEQQVLTGCVVAVQHDFLAGERE